MADARRFKYGLFLHPAVPNPHGAALRYTDELLDSFVDPVDPALGSVTVRWELPIVRLDDSGVFAVTHTPRTRQLLTDDGDGPIRQGLLEVLDWWNGETLLIAPEKHALEWDQHALPNAWSKPWQGLVEQTITQYPKRLGHRVLAEWNPGLLYLPFELLYTPPTREDEAAAMARWTAQQEALVKDSLARLMALPAGPWFFTTAQRYRSAMAPLPTGFRAVGSAEQAEQAAMEYRGACFLVNQTTGEILWRWCER